MTDEKGKMPRFGGKMMNGNLVEGKLWNMTSLYLRHGNELLL